MLTWFFFYQTLHLNFFSADPALISLFLLFVSASQLIEMSTPNQIIFLFFFKDKLVKNHASFSCSLPSTSNIFLFYKILPQKKKVATGSYLSIYSCLGVKFNNPSSELQDVQFKTTKQNATSTQHSNTLINIKIKYFEFKHFFLKWSP